MIKRSHLTCKIKTCNIKINLNDLVKLVEDYDYSFKLSYSNFEIDNSKFYTYSYLIKFIRDYDDVSTVNDIFTDTDYIYKHIKEKFNLKEDTSKVRLQFNVVKIKD